MLDTVLIVPGYRGSGPTHWQTWLQSQLPNARRVSGIDWERPVLSAWATAVRGEIDRAPGAVWLVAHSFGCLAALVAAAERRDRVAGALLVAPADPARVGVAGFRRDANGARLGSVETLLPYVCLPPASIIAASSNDPFMPLERAQHCAERWGGAFVSIGPAGHINTESGFGAWPLGLHLLRQLQTAHGGDLLGSMQDSGPVPKRRERVLARLRRATRIEFDLV